MKKPKFDCRLRLVSTRNIRNNLLEAIAKLQKRSIDPSPELAKLRLDIKAILKSDSGPRVLGREEESVINKNLAPIVKDLLEMAASGIVNDDILNDHKDIIKLHLKQYEEGTLYPLDLISSMRDFLDESDGSELSENTLCTAYISAVKETHHFYSHYVSTQMANSAVYRELMEDLKDGLREPMHEGVFLVKDTIHCVWDDEAVQLTGVDRFCDRGLYDLVPKQQEAQIEL